MSYLTDAFFDVSIFIYACVPVKAQVIPPLTVPDGSAMSHFMLSVYSAPPTLLCSQSLVLLMLV